MFKRLFTRHPKINTTNYMNSAREFNPDTETGGSSSLWNDKVNPPQSYLIRNKMINESSPAHRHAQMERNPFFFKLSRGVAQKLFMKKPYPFSYAKPYEMSINGNTSSESAQAGAPLGAARQTTQPNRGDAQVKSNSVPSANPFNVPGTNPFESQPGAAVQQPPAVTFELRDDMSYLYELWRQDNMFEACEDAFGRGIGINASVILKQTSNDKTHFFIFDSSHIRKVYTRDRMPVALDIEWPAWPNCEDVGNKVIDKAIEKYEIGKNCVLFIPFPTVNNPLGKSVFLPVWYAGVGKDYARFIHLLYAWKGGILSKYFRIPNTTSAAIKDRIELEAKKGILSEAVILEHPAGISPENIDKQFAHEEVNANDINWEELNSLLSQDSPFPKSYIEGQVETGALGGSAPEEDAAKEDEATFYYFHLLDKLVHMINETFYNITDQSYIVIPFQDMPGNGTTPPLADQPAKPIPEDKPTPTEEVEEKEKTKTKRTMKFNSITPEGLHRFDAVLLPVGEFDYDGHSEVVTLDAIKQFVDDPKSVKEGYVQNEHPDNPAEVLKDDAMGKYQITGYDERGMIGVVDFFKDPGQSELSLSNFYYSHDEMKSGKPHHSRIDYRNVVVTSRPRMRAAKAKRR